MHENLPNNQFNQATDISSSSSILQSRNNMLNNNSFNNISSFDQDVKAYSSSSNVMMHNQSSLLLPHGGSNSSSSTHRYAALSQAINTFPMTLEPPLSTKSMSATVLPSAPTTTRSNKSTKSSKSVSRYTDELITPLRAAIATTATNFIPTVVATPQVKSMTNDKELMTNDKELKAITKAPTVNSSRLPEVPISRDLKTDSMSSKFELHIMFYERLADLINNRYLDASLDNQSDRLIDR